nr:MAG TPA: hypothetical protein [Caudoviricetes sp.]
MAFIKVPVVLKPQMMVAVIQTEICQLALNTLGVGGV